MLSVGPGARRISPSQDVHLKNKLPAISVMYITDTAPSASAQCELAAAHHRPGPCQPGTGGLRGAHDQGRADFSRSRI
jgi:hypothetical protein